MGIWIRSQNGEYLIESIALEVHLNSIHALKDKHDYKVIGTYESRERALKVLDEVQSHIISARENQNCPPSVDASYWNSVFTVFKMPKQ